MRFKLGHPDYPSHDFYLMSFTPEVEAQVNRLGPRAVIASAYDWPPKTYDYHGFADTINCLWWPRGGDQFSSLFLIIDDTRATKIKSSIQAQWDALSPGLGKARTVRPHLVLQALLAPTESDQAPEVYEPANMTSGDVSTTDETELMAWKLYPLPPVPLAAVDGADTFEGLWLLPLVDIRYFYRLGPIDSDRDDYSGSGQSSFPVANVDTDEQADWMPPLRAYPDDSAQPGDYVPIANNNTHPGIATITNRGVAADLQATMENWRVVCRDVRSNWNALGGTAHTDFTGIVCDYPDNATVGHLLFAEVESGGTGYVVGDVLTLSGGTFSAAATITVDNVDEFGAVTEVSVTTGGTYTVAPDNPIVTTGGTGDGGCEVNGLFGSGSSYHRDALGLAFNQYVTAGGLTQPAVTAELVARKLRIRFRIANSTATYEIDIYPTVARSAFPGSTSDLDEDQTEPTTEEKLYLPKVVLGVECPSTNPTGSTRTDLVTAAKQWSILYYRWRSLQCYIKYPKIAPVMPNGYASIIKWEFSATKFETTYVAVDGIGGTQDDGLAGTGGTGSDGFWARLTAKQYVTNGFIAYSWTKVTDNSAAALPIDWENAASSGAPGNFPAYEVNNIDVVVSSGTGSGSGSGTTEDDNPTIVWVRRGVGDYYLFDSQPRWEFVQKTGQADAAGRFAGVLLRYNQETKQFEAVEDVVIIDANAL